MIRKSTNKPVAKAAATRKPNLREAILCAAEELFSTNGFNAVSRRIIAQTFADTSHAFIDAIHESLPHVPRTEIVWRGHFLLGALYYTLVTPERVSRLSQGEADGSDAANAIEQLVRATVASLQAPALDQPAPSRHRAAEHTKT